MGVSLFTGADLFDGENFVEDQGVLVEDGGIVALCPAGEAVTADTLIELKGGLLAPGFIDAHVHIESSLVPPAEFARTVFPRGTTTVVTDPHEIANVLGLVAAACDDDETDTPQTGDANAQLCSDLSALDAALASLASTATNANSTVDQLNSARDAVNSALESVRSSAEGVSGAVTSDLESAYSTLEQEISEISDDATLAEAAVSVESSVQTVIAAELQIRSELGC